MAEQSSELSSELSSATNEQAAPDSSQTASQVFRDGRHWMYLAIAVVILLLSVSLSVESRQGVVIPGIGLQLPTLCSFRRMTGVDCPGCGLTRCFISLGHGDLKTAWQFNSVGILLDAFVIFQIPFRIVQIVRIRRGLEEMPNTFGMWVLGGCAVLLLVQWIARIVMGLGLGVG